MHHVDVHGRHDDDVTIKNANLGRILGHTVTISTDAGADILKIGSDAVSLGAVGVAGNLILKTGSDSGIENDVVKIRDLDVDGTIFAEFGGGDDNVNMANVLARKSISLKAMGGNDTIVMNDVEAFEEVFANMGEGSDTLDITLVKAAAVTLDGDGANGDGFDRLFLTQSPNIGTLVRTGFEEINGARLIKKTTPTPTPTRT